MLHSLDFGRVPGVMRTTGASRPRQRLRPAAETGGHPYLSKGSLRLYRFLPSWAASFDRDWLVQCGVHDHWTIFWTPHWARPAAHGGYEIDFTERSRWRL